MALLPLCLNCLHLPRRAFHRGWSLVALGHLSLTVDHSIGGRVSILDR
jgi:hypothetical protein